MRTSKEAGRNVGHCSQMCATENRNDFIKRVLARGRIVLKC